METALVTTSNISQYQNCEKGDEYFGFDKQFYEEYKLGELFWFINNQRNQFESDFMKRKKWYKSGVGLDIDRLRNDLKEKAKNQKSLTITINSIRDKLKLLARMRVLNIDFNITKMVRDWALCQIGIDWFELEKYDIWSIFFETSFVDKIPDEYIDLAISHAKNEWNNGKVGKFQEYLDVVEVGIEPFFQKSCEFLQIACGGKLKIIDNTQSKIFVGSDIQPKQSISYQLGEEVIEAELIEDKVEVKQVKSTEHVEVEQVEVNHNPNIQTYTRNNQSYFNARDVWKQLGVKSSFSSWMKAKKRKHLLEQAIQTIEFRSGRNTRSVDWLIPIELMEDLVHSVAK